MIYVVYTPKHGYGYMAYEGTLHHSTHYGAYDESGRNYWVDDIKLLTDPPYLVHHEGYLEFEDGATYRPFPTWESLAHYEDYPECFI